ncbi:MAG: SAM-dependent methyltransferase, partial [Muribaculaceae bacterium]|nr:SAM-dependent methyltransferase [Muribaculaceae bacterium]
DIPANESAYIVEKINSGEIIYEPSACVLKSGAANMIANRYLLKKIHNNSHLYVSDDLQKDFPGRILHICRVEDFHSRNIKSLGKEYPKLNITTRNFPITAQELSNKMKCKDGGNDYLFATTMEPNQPVLIFCKR